MPHSLVLVHYVLEIIRDESRDFIPSHLDVVLLAEIKETHSRIVKKELVKTSNKGRTFAGVAYLSTFIH